MAKGNLSDNEKEEMKALQDLRKGAGNGGAVITDSQRLRLTALLQKSKGEDASGQTISGEGNAPSTSNTTISGANKGTDGKSVIGNKA